MSPLNQFPWFRAYTAEIDDLHGQFSPAECWAYMLIQRAIWQRGPIPPVEMQKVARVHGHAWRAMWPRLMPLFELRPDLGGWTQGRLEAERAAAMSSLDQKREAGKARHRKPVDNPPVEERHETISASYEAHMKLISPPKSWGETYKFSNLGSAGAPQIEIEKENLKYPINPKREVTLSAKSLPQRRREVSLEQELDRSTTPALDAASLVARTVDIGRANGFAVASGSTDDQATPSLPVAEPPACSTVTQQDQTIAASAVVYSLPTAKQKEPRGSRLPDNWRPSPQEWQFALDHGLKPEKVLELFTSHWRAEAGQGARKADWNAAWHKWCLRERPQQQRQAGLPLMSVTRSTAPLDPNDKWGIEAWCTAHPDIKLIEGSDATPEVLAKGKWAYGGKIFDHVACKVAAAAGFGRDRRIDWTPLMGWLDAGHAVNDHIILKVQRLADFMRSKDNPPRSLKVFDKAVTDGTVRKQTPKAPADPTDPWGIQAFCASLPGVIAITDPKYHDRGKWEYQKIIIDYVARQIATAAKFDRAKCIDWSLLASWLDAGINTSEHIISTVKRVAEWMNSQGNPPRSLQAFNKAITERRAA